jgi:hypothetical protein
MAVNLLCSSTPFKSKILWEARWLISIKSSHFSRWLIVQLVSCFHLNQTTSKISVYPGLCTYRAPQPFFGGYPLKINLNHDHFHDHLCTLMIQIHGTSTKYATSLCHLLILDWAQLACPVLGRSCVGSLHMVALSSRGNNAWVALFAIVPRLDHKGCCVHRSHSCGLVSYPKLLWEIPESVHLDWSVTFFHFLCISSRPNKFFTGFCQTSCLIAVIACWACTFVCSWVPHDGADTLNSTLSSGVSFLAVTLAFIAI